MNFLADVAGRFLNKELLEKIAAIKIGIAGVGGLGSNCAFNLVRSGFMKFSLIDYDFVSISNLNRQFYFADQVGQPKVYALKDNLLRINPCLELELHQVKLTKENIKNYFNDCQVVVEAFDSAEGKSMLVAAYINTGRLIVSASGLAGWGDSDMIKVHRLKKDFYLIGDLETEVNVIHPPMSPRVNITAAKMADVVLEYVLKEEEVRIQNPEVAI